MNYTIMDDYSENVDNGDFNINYKKTNNYNIKKIFLILIPLVIIILIVYFYIQSNGSSRYKDIENQMVSEAKIYVQNNNLNGTNGLYITIDKLSSIQLNDNCSDISGVVVEGNNYYPYLVCNDYKSIIITNEEKYGNLNGEEIVVVDDNYEYQDLGITSQYEFDVITDYVNREGVYTYLYKIKENNNNLETIKRKVIVINNDNNQNYPDIKLNGEEIIYLSIGEVYNEQGVIAIDVKDGNITSLVKITNNVNYNIVGEYEIKYSVVNSQGYSSFAIRKIIIGEKSTTDEIVINTISSPVGYTNGSVKIMLMISGDSYKHTVLPDGTINTNTLIEYEALKNDNYSFLIYDKNEKVTTKQIEVTNIDKEIPKGTCNAVVYKEYTEVNVKNVSESSCIYNYETTSYSSVYMNESSYKMPVGDIEKVTVNIKDLAGNIGTISCTVEKDLSVINKEYITDKGYNCIEPYTCLKQGDYWRTDYCYYSTDTCGPISKRGCSITALATVLSKWDKRSSNGELFTPYTLMDEVYDCTYCSGTTNSKRVFEKLGLQVVGDSHYKLNMENYDLLLNHLKTGNPALIRVSSDNGGWYTDGGHIMSLLTANEEGLVYLYDTGTKIGTKNSWGHDVNTFVPLEDVINHCGSSCWFQMVKE